MTINEARIDRILRIALGLILIGLALGGAFTPWGWIGVIPLASGLVGFCPLYHLVGINTCRIRKA